MLAATWPTISLSMPLTLMRVGAGTSKVMPVGGVDDDRVAEAEGQLDLARAPGHGPVADADDLEVLGEAVGDAEDHVVDQAAGQAVQGPVLALVVGRSTKRVESSWRTVISPGSIPLQGAPAGP